MYRLLNALQLIVWIVALACATANDQINIDIMSLLSKHNDTSANQTAFDADLVLSGTVLPSEAQAKYTLFGGNRAGVLTAKWRLLGTGNVKEAAVTSWGRVQSTSGSASLCIFIADLSSSDSGSAIALNEEITSVCGDEDIVMLMFPLSVPMSVVNQFKNLDPTGNRTSLNDLVVTTVTGESSSLHKENQNHVLLAMTMRVCQNEAHLEGSDVAMSQLCQGKDCPCAGTSLRSGKSAPAKSGLVVFVSLAALLAGSALVLLVIFRKQFFLPSGDAKQEKDVVSNLAYVLRID